MADLSDPSVAGPYGALAALAAAIAGALGFGRGKATAPKGGGVAGLGERVGALELKTSAIDRNSGGGGAGISGAVALLPGSPLGFPGRSPSGGRPAALSGADAPPAVEASRNPERSSPRRVGSLRLPGRTSRRRIDRGDFRSRLPPGG